MKELPAYQNMDVITRSSSQQTHALQAMLNEFNCMVTNVLGNRAMLSAGYLHLFPNSWELYAANLLHLGSLRPMLGLMAIS
jgi:hypothetical protein